MMVMLQGHAYDTLPTTIYLGLVTAMTAVMTAAAIIAAGLLWRLPYPATRLGLRILSSWVAAIGVMYLAFMMRNVLQQ